MNQTQLELKKQPFKTKLFMLPVTVQPSDILEPDEQLKILNEFEAFALHQGDIALENERQKRLQKSIERNK